MSLDPVQLAAFISADTGLEFVPRRGNDPDGNRWVTFEPSGYDQQHTFLIRATIKWRRLDLSFEAGKFAGPLLEAMARADNEARAVFRAVLEDCMQDATSIIFQINGIDASFVDSSSWPLHWKRVTFGISKGNIELGESDERDDEIVRSWASRFAAAVVALLPLEAEQQTPELEGFPEGAKLRVEVNKYERDRRNRSAALAIHGHRCLACGFSFEKKYGLIAEGYIEVHHTTPVSKLGDDYVIDPRNDLIPLCSNCHSVVHRRIPPLTLEEIVTIIESRVVDDANEP